MPIRVASHLYRNRHGTFYFRITTPRELLHYVGLCEIRLSLATEVRGEAIIGSLLLIADLPRLTVDLNRMSNSAESLPPDYFNLWRLQILENGSLRTKITILNEELKEQQYPAR